MSDRTRAFMALLLPPELVEAAAAVQDQVRERFPAGAVRWVDPGLFHLTVRFFGDLDRRQLARAGGVVEGLRGGLGEVPVTIGGVSAFPSAGRPQTLWIGIDSTGDGLAGLAAEIDRRIREAGFGPADKAWKSHLTIGRVGRDRHLKVEPSWTAGLTWEKRVFTITAVALMQSELRPQGPRYTPLAIMTASGDGGGPLPRQDR